MSEIAVQPIDPLLRLRALAAALPGSRIAERVISIPFARVWAVIVQLESMVPRYEANVARVDVVKWQGERGQILVTLRNGHVEPMAVRMLPGWCLMHSPTTVVAFAARAAGDQTVLAHLEHDRRTPWDGMPHPEAAVNAKLAGELEAIELLAQTHDQA